jgi:HEAT repeat protein
MTSSIAPLLEGFSDRPTAVKDELKTYATCDPSGFREEALQLIKKGGDDAARRYVLQLLLKHAQLAAYLADPEQSITEDAIAAAKTALALGVPLDAALENILQGIVKDSGAGPTIVRLIDLFAALSLGKIVLRLQKELVAHPDLQVCSRAVFELVKAGKGAALVAQTLLQGDPRVQANAVEALWGVTDKSATPVLMIAAKSPHHCVAANGLVGLYRQGVLDSIPQLLRMAAHQNPAHRESAIAAIGQTGDPRFLPYLTSEFAKTEGKEKLGIVRALSRIRKHCRDADGTGKVIITPYESQILPDGARRIVVSLWVPDQDLAAISPTQFAIWEENELVTRYSTQCLASPPLLILGFAVPRFVSIADPYAEAVAHALNACVELKRSTDPWCLERYLVDEQSRTAVKEKSSLASTDDHSPLGLHMKNHRGFITDGAFFREAIKEPGRRERAALDAGAVIDKLVDTTSRLSGPRHLFVFFDPQDISDNAIRRLATSLKNEPVTLHGFAPSSGADSTALRELCAGTNQGTFQSLALEQLEGAVKETYLGLLDRYEIVYRVDAGATTTPRCEVRVSTSSGTGLLTCFPS